MRPRLWCIVVGTVALVLTGCEEATLPAAPATPSSSPAPTSDRERFEEELARVEQEAYYRGYEQGHADGRNEGFYEGLRAAEEGKFPRGPMGDERPWWVDVEIPPGSPQPGGGR